MESFFWLEFVDDIRDGEGVWFALFFIPFGVISYVIVMAIVLFLSLMSVVFLPILVRVFSFFFFFLTKLEICLLFPMMLL